MITANAIQEPNGCYVLELTGPKEARIKTKKITVNSIAEAKRVVYFQNRKYIFSKLISFLHQRKQAVRITNHVDKMTELIMLEHFLLQYEFSSFFAVCRFVAGRTEKFEYVAPRETSQHYKHYQKVIQPILNYCRHIAAKGE